MSKQDKSRERKTIPTERIDLVNREASDDFEVSLESLKEFLGSEPTPSEIQLVRSVLLDDRIDYSKTFPGEDRTDQREAWETSRTIRAGCVEWLLSDKQIQGKMPRRGLRIWGAKIRGDLTLDHVCATFPIEFVACLLNGPINLAEARLKSLDLSGSQLCGLDASDAKFTSNVILSNGFKTDGMLSLMGAEIGGQLSCRDSRFLNPGGDAIMAEGIKVGGSVHLLDNVRTEGRVSLLWASIGGQLGFTGSEFVNPKGDALLCEGVTVAGSVFLNEGFKARGRVSLWGATIGGNLTCSGGSFFNKDGDALFAERANVTGNMFLDEKFEAVGRVSLIGAEIGSQLDCSGSAFRNPGGDALIAQSISVNGDVFLRNGFTSEGRVYVGGAEILGQLCCTNGKFRNASGDALTAQSTSIGGGVLFNGEFKAQGRVSLIGAKIGRQLICTHGKFLNPEGIALIAQSAHITGDAFLNNGFEAQGMVMLTGAIVDGNLICIKGEFSNPSDSALIAEGVEVKGGVYLGKGFRAAGCVSFKDAKIIGVFGWWDIKDPEHASLVLTGAHVGKLGDDLASWPEAGNLHLQGLRYDGIDDNAPLGSEDRIRWLRLQPEDRFHPQTYEQLAKVMQESGHDKAARDIRIAKNDDWQRRGDMPLLLRAPYLFFKFTTGYGYKPFKPVLLALVLIAIGWWLFNVGERENIILNTGRTLFVSSRRGCAVLAYPEFHPLLYSVDAFLPIIEFEHSQNWSPNERQSGDLVGRIRVSGLALRRYEWFLNMAGWVLTTLFITALTVSIRRRLS